MARVSQKRVRQLLNEERSRITDRQFFLSRLVAGHFQDIAAAQTRRYGYDRRVNVTTVWEPRNDDIACTDNNVIWINAGHERVTHYKTRRDRYEMVGGLFTHELGHALYTDFLSFQTYANRMVAGTWYPDRPAFVEPSLCFNMAELEEYRSKSQHHAARLLMVAKELSNVIEDGYIEERLLYEYPGVLGQQLQFMRNDVWENHPTCTQTIEDEEDVRLMFCSIRAAMLSYALYGEIKYGETPMSDERIQMVFQCLGDIDRGLLTRDARVRWDCVNRIMVRCWKYIKPFLDYCEEHGDPQSGGVGTVSTAIRGAGGGSAIGSGVTGPVTGGPEPPEECITAPNRAATQADAEGETASAPMEFEEEDADDATTALAQGGEPERIPLQQTAAISAPNRGGKEQDDSYTGLDYDAAGRDIEALLNSMAAERLEEKRAKALNELAQNISYGNAHEGVKVTVRRIAALDDGYRERYDAVAPQLLAISKQLQRNILRQLQDQRRGGKQTGLYMGRRLDVHALSRNDGRIFSKSSLPNETPELAVSLLLDESGSMSGRRSTYARAAAVILYDFCDCLDIPVMVYGHSTGNGGVCLYSYAEFDAIDRQDRYRLMDISARSSNRDGLALRYCAEQLSKRPEDVKLLILVSDGQPADSGYIGTAAEEDLRGIKQEYRRKGVNLIAAAIGDDRDAIERIYGDSFLNISDLTQLPITLTQMVKRSIRL